MARSFLAYQITFDLNALLSAWNLLVNASTELNGDLFRYDLVDVTKEVLQYKFAIDFFQLVAAYNRSDLCGVA